MPFAAVSRRLLVGALVHLTVAGGILLFPQALGAVTVRWDLEVWLLLVGFAGCTTLGFSLHLFPAVSHRRLPAGPLAAIAATAAEGGVVLGAVALAPGDPSGGWGTVFAAGAALFLAAVALGFYLFAASLREPSALRQLPEKRAGDAATIPLFLLSWAAALGAGIFFVLSGLESGPGFGWWLAAVHLFALGHLVLLVTAVSLRLVPRSLDADPAPAAVTLLVGLGGAGAVLIPVAFLLLAPSAARGLDLLALPEAAFAILFVAVVVDLVRRAKVHRREVALHLTGLLFFVAGGAVALGMVYSADYTPVVGHAALVLLGFVGLIVLFMWFGMVAPFQRISHAWTRRMLWTLSAVWGVAVALFAGSALAFPASEGWALPLGGGLLLAAGLAWGVGTIPVLYPSLNPLPGRSSEELRRLRERWRAR